MEDIEKIFAESLQQYSKYYSKMYKSIDYVNSLEEELIGTDNVYPYEIQQMYPLICENISFDEMRKVNVAEFRATIVEPFINSLEGLAQEILKDVWVGHLPIHRPNALCKYVPNTMSLPVVIIHDKILGALSFKVESLLIFSELLKHNEKIAHFYLYYSSQKLVDFFTKKIEKLPVYSLPSEVKISYLFSYLCF